MMKREVLSVVTLLMCNFIAFSQTVFSPGGIIGTSVNDSIGMGINSPTEFVHIQGQGISPYLKVDRVGSPSSPYGGYGIKIGTNGSLYTNIFPSCGSGAFFIKGNDSNGNVIMFRGSSINFGTAPTCAGGSGGAFNFGGGNVWVNDGLVISAYNTPGAGGYTLPSGYKLAVNGKANFSEEVVIGNVISLSSGYQLFVKEGIQAGKLKVNDSIIISGTSGPTYSLPTGYRLGVNGDANFTNKVVIGPYDSFTQGTPSGYNLFVSNGIITEKLKVAVKTTSEWADYVFSDKYKLMSLKEVEQFVKTNNHLPNVPSAQEVVEHGIDVARMDAKLLEKIEELTLYIIEQDKRIKELEHYIKLR